MEAEMSKKERQNNIFINSMEDVSSTQRKELLDEVMRVEREAWPEEWQATRDKFESRLAIFPDGFFVAFKGRRMVGVSTSEIVNYDPENLPKTWDEITDNGRIKETHDKFGNALYVVSVGVSQEFQGKGIGKRLTEAQKRLAQKLGLRYLFLGARVPGYQSYHKEHPEVSVEDYVRLEEDPANKLDPELRFYESCGLKMLKTMPDYGPDPESENYGVIMVWEAER